MTTVVVLNAGSTSLKASALDDADTVLSALELDPWDGSPDHPELRAFLSDFGNETVVGHRVVHGGSRFTGPVMIDNSVLAAIRSLTDLAPLHQPRAVPLGGGVLDGGETALGTCPPGRRPRCQGSARASCSAPACPAGR